LKTRSPWLRGLRFRSGGLVSGAWRAHHIAPAASRQLRTFNGDGQLPRSGRSFRQTSCVRFRLVADIDPLPVLRKRPLSGCYGWEADISPSARAL
jgi:hypothetical protein